MMQHAANDVFLLGQKPDEFQDGNIFEPRPHSKAPSPSSDEHLRPHSWTVVSLYALTMCGSVLIALIVQNK